MAVDHFDILNSAKNIASISGDEAHIRGCISRLYYSGFHAADFFGNSLPVKGISQADVGSHQNLVHELRNPNVDRSNPNFSKSIEIGTYLQKCLYARHQADYRISQPVNVRSLELVDSNIDLIFDAIK